MSQFTSLTGLLLIGAATWFVHSPLATTGTPAHGRARIATVYGDWTGLPAQDDPEFGYSVAMDGDWLAVGAPQTIVDGGSHGVGRKGALFLFHREGGTWQYHTR